MHNTSQYLNTCFMRMKSIGHIGNILIAISLNRKS